MSATCTAEWTIPGADGEAIRGNTHLDPGREARGVALLAHGFKGYKDYGFIPILAEHLASSLPLVVHRFNFSHSGMGEDPSTFQREDLFEKATRNKQVFDLDTLIERAAQGELEATPSGLPLTLLGHSRGGVDVLVDAGRRFRDGRQPLPAGVVAMAAPSRSLTITPEQQVEMREKGHMVSPSGRTGQQLHVGLGWLEEQLASPADFDMETLCAQITCPVLIAHGKDDPTVPAVCAEQLGEACPNQRTLLIDACDHVFNTKNPADPMAPPSVQLQRLMDGVTSFLAESVLRV